MSNLKKLPARKKIQAFRFKRVECKNTSAATVDTDPTSPLTLTTTHVA